jgi:hypothetical protein
VQIVTRVPLSLYLGPRLVNVASLAYKILTANHVLIMQPRGRTTDECSLRVVYVYPKCPAGNSEGHWLSALHRFASVFSKPSILTLELTFFLLSLFLACVDMLECKGTPGEAGAGPCPRPRPSYTHTHTHWCWLNLLGLC